MTALQSVLTLWAATSVPATLDILEMDTPVQVNQQHTPCQITKSLAAIKLYSTVIITIPTYIYVVLTVKMM